jgi:tetratricopeptide (TPR) repeat protein
MKLIIYLLIAIALSCQTFAQSNDSSLQTRVYLINEAIKAKTSGDFEKVVLIIDSVIKIDSCHFGSYIIKSNALLQLERFAESAEAFRKAVLLGKPDIGSYVRLGMLYEKANKPLLAKKQYAQAIQHYEHTITKPKAEMWQTVEYVIALLLNDEKTKSDIEYRRLLRHFPNEETVINLQGKSRFQILESRLR